MPGVTREHERLIRYVEPQGVNVTRTKKGMLFRFPNGETEMIHFTQSDWRALRNVRANFRRNGIEWPGDLKGKKPYKSTIANVQAAVEQLQAEHKQVTGVAIKRIMGVSSSPGPGGAIYNALVSMGWWHEYHTPNSRATLIWHPPINPHEVIEEVAPDPDDAPPTPTPTAPEVREFIDTADSWTVDLSAVDPTMSVGQLMTAYAASALVAELRIWRAPQ